VGQGGAARVAVVARGGARPITPTGHPRESGDPAFLCLLTALTPFLALDQLSKPYLE
jgi:hypothetical protein